LDERHVDVNAWWHAIDNTSNSRTMTLAEGGQSE
jgi:hypothetical protein